MATRIRIVPIAEKRIMRKYQMPTDGSQYFKIRHTWVVVVLTKNEKCEQSAAAPSRAWPEGVPLCANCRGWAPGRDDTYVHMLSRVIVT